MAPRDTDSLLPQLLSFPPHPPPPVPLVDAAYDKEIKSLRRVLNDTPANALTAGAPYGGDLLEILDPSINTLPFLYVLLAHLSAGKRKATTIGSPLWFKALIFLDRFDPVQIRYVGTEFRRLVVCVKDMALAGKKPIAAVRPIGAAILRLDPSASCFTSTHLLFVRLCLEARTFRAAKPILDKDIYEFPLSAKTLPSGVLACSQHDTSAGFITDRSELSDTISYRDPLCYFLYGATIYMALKEWQRAILLLEAVLTAPSKGQSSQIQVEAYKKWVLANLLAYGEVPGSLPRTTDSRTAKHVRSLGKAYEALGKIFKEGILKEHDDYNLSLVLQVLDAYRQFTIAKLESTYVALPLSEVSRRSSPNPNDHPETAQYIATMINSGQLNATIEQNHQDLQSWVLRFTASSSIGPQSRTEQEQYEELKRQTARTAQVAEHVRETDRKLSLNKEYINWLRQKADMAASVNAGEESSIMPNQISIEDEDIMGEA
ncbi:MAG: hypothetical protein Q9171_002192 [Xanthocarpia ochracea]